MSELRRIGNFKESGLSGGRVVLSDEEGDIRLVYRDGALYLHDKEPVGAYVEREVLPRVEGLRDTVEDNIHDLVSLRNDYERDVKELRDALYRLGEGGGSLKELELSMPLDKIVNGRLLHYTGRHGGYKKTDDVLKGFEGVTYDMTLGDVLRSSLLCLDVSEAIVPNRGVIRLIAELVSRDGLEQRYFGFSSYKPVLYWNRFSPGGVDRSGEKDSEWNERWRGRLFAEYSPSSLYDGTEFRCSMRKYDALLVYVSAKLQGGIEI